jgi:hypothetical protein
MLPGNQAGKGSKYVDALFIPKNRNGDDVISEEFSLEL